MTKKPIYKSQKQLAKKYGKNPEKTLTNKECDITKYGACYSMAMLNDAQYTYQNSNLVAPVVNFKVDFFFKKVAFTENSNYVRESLLEV